ncbi:pyrroline-5-carboxylate reductase [Aliikangiella sp. IMCC44653]
MNSEQTSQQSTKSVSNQLKAQPKVAFIGCGNMARAIILGMLKSGWPVNSVMGSNPSQGKLNLLLEHYPMPTTHNNQQAVEFADIVVLAVKPQKMLEVCRPLAHIDMRTKLVISVAAGFPADKIANAFEQDIAVIRAMPNTPALIGSGATGLYANAKVSSQQKAQAEAIFGSVGKSAWVENESDINTVTAIAGSSPAYVFLMMQSMVEQAIACGLSQSTAKALVTQAFLGTAQLAQETPAKSLEQLRKEVTSPGGTTAAAINSLIGDNFEAIVKSAVTAAIRRGEELGAG